MKEFNLSLPVCPQGTYFDFSRSGLASAAFDAHVLKNLPRKPIPRIVHGQLMTQLAPRVAKGIPIVPATFGEIRRT